MKKIYKCICGYEKIYEYDKGIKPDTKCPICGKEMIEQGQVGKN